MNPIPLGKSAVAAATLCLAAAGAAAQDAAVRNLGDMEFHPFPGFPTCTTGTVQKGDPAKEPSIILAKANKGCAIPWHWHTPNEHLMMMSGAATLEMKEGGKPQTLKAGGFAIMPSKHVHRFQCITKTCLVYIYADAAPFDIHYVDAQGTEIQPDQALKAVKETAAK
jgi:quercetin dioxygenase-like cupin family protein